MLARWDGTYGVEVSWDDWCTTCHGGTSYVSTSGGVQYAVDPGSLVGTALHAGIPAAVPAYLLCGGSATIAELDDESRGPSDGVASGAPCEESTGIGTVGAVTLVAGDDHLALGREPSAEQQIASWLAA